MEFLERTSRPEAGRPPYPYLSFCESTSLVAAGEEGREVLGLVPTYEGFSPMDHDAKRRDKAKHSAC